MRQRVLVLGADGFIGRKVVAALAGTEWALPVAALRRSPPDTYGGEYQLLDASDTAALQRALSDVQAVVNCVAGGDSLVAVPRALSAAAGAQPHTPRVIHLSSMSVYGCATGEIDETSPLQGDLGPYGVAKIAAEQLALQYPQCVVLRPGCVYGPGSVQWSQRIAGLLRAHRVGDLGAAGDGYCNLVYIHDLVRAIIRSLQLSSLQQQIFNIGIPNPPTWNEYFLRFARALGTVPIRRISERQLALETKILAAPLKIAELLGDRLGLRRLPAPIPPSLARLWRQEIRLSVDRAQTHLQMTWTELEEGLRTTAAWCDSSA